MGLFGGKKTYVASVAYNLAGDEADRPNYLKTAVVGNIISEFDSSIGDMIRASYLNGPGIKIRNFYNWAVDNYGLIGVPQGFRSGSPDTETLAEVLPEIIPHDPGEEVSITTIEIGQADYSYWADQWMLEHYPELIDTEWTSDHNETTGDILITFEDESIATFTPVGFSRSGMYIYASYTINRGPGSGPVEEGSVIDIGSGEFPGDVSGWVVESEDVTPHTVSLDVTTNVSSTYSDARPPTSSSDTVSHDESYDEFHNVYSLTEYEGLEEGLPGEDDRIHSTKSIQHRWQDGSVTTTTGAPVTTTTDIGGGVIRTDVTTVVTDVIVMERSYRDDTQDLTLEAWSATKVYIYKVGSGEPDLDAFLEDNGDNGGYLPFIPVRLDNQFLSSTYMPDIYALASKAYKKATRGAKFDDLVDKIAQNDSLPDIDYAYIVFGVSLNVVENAGRKYVYDFFHNIMETQVTTRADFDEWFTEKEFYDDAYSAWVEWEAAQSDPEDPLYGTTAPELLQSTAAPISEVKISSTGTGGLSTNLNITITWNAIEESTGSGLAKPGAKRDELWFESIPGTTERIMLYHQVDEDSWKALTITGMTHKNFIYNGKFIEIKSRDALADEEESGFIVPLRYETLREMSLIDSTQLSVCSTFILFNSYKVVKQKWYQTGIFKIIVVIITIAIAVFFGPQTAMLFAGIVQMTTGFNPLLMDVLFKALFHIGLTELVMLVLVKVLSVVPTILFGEKIGKAIGTISAVVVIAVGTTMAGGASFTEALNSVFSLSAQSIMTLTSAVGQGVAVYTGIGTSNIINSNEQLVKDYEKESKRISELYRQNFGSSEGVIDPMLLTQATYIVIESEAAFLGRTLLTGSDISEITMRVIDNFSKMNLDLTLSD